ncbi:DUF3352 domain-containing protein [Leptolyngbya sp. FACHB-261]|uniref:DUF3352 domain-containing protein n=1 Tax=Leptolyngbya sp. FACHB-261 TaxID=2692806 RepID=UPI00168760B2|nr:DUF3352 domain-containing protein [Leptolyngbya sp. FACHB-261]MBD2103144.1 DUF3352 domain-containing protein [Leptolyngbya sp. FACHB-261]
MKLSAPNRRTIYLAIAAVVLVLLLISSSGIYWLLNRSPLALRTGVKTAPLAASLVSRQAPAVVSLLVNPDRLQQLRQFSIKPSERSRSQREWQRLRAQLIGPKLNYDRDVRPWLGDELTVAVTTPDIDRDTNNGKQPGYLLALTTQAADRSREFLQLFWQQRAVGGSELVFEQYQGVPVIYEQTGTELEPGLTTAVVGERFVLFANHPKVLRAAINNLQVPELALTGLESYQQAVNNLERGRVALAFLNLPELAGWASNNGILPSLEEASLKDWAGGIGVGLGIEAPGLLAESVLVAPGLKDTLVSATPKLSEPPPVLNYLPSNSLLALAGSDLNQLWQSVSTELAPVQGDDVLNRWVTNLEERTGLDLPQDIFAWVTSDYALGLLPSRADNQPDFVFAARRTDPVAVQEALTRLDGLALNRAKLTVGQLELGDQNVTVWTRLVSVPVPQKNSKRKDNSEPLSDPVVLQAPVVGVHAELGDYVLFSSSVEAMDLALRASQFALVSTPAFREAVAALPQPNDGYLYVNWQADLPLLESRFPVVAALHKVVAPLLDPLQTLALSSYGGPAGVRRAQTFIALD